MILPVQAALERLPPSLLQASADLGARPHDKPFAMWLLLAIRVLPLALSLPSSPRWAILLSRSWLALRIFYRQYGLFPAGAIGNMPMAAAFTLVPIVLIALYLAFVKRLGAFDAL